MKSNQKILDAFGRHLIDKVFDTNYEIVHNEIKFFQNTDGFKNLFKGIGLEGKREFEVVIYEILQNALYEFLAIFEENIAYKLMYEEDGTQVNLVALSETLKENIHGETGWIARFSRELNEGDNES